MYTRAPPSVQHLDGIFDVIASVGKGLATSLPQIASTALAFKDSQTQLKIAQLQTRAALAAATPPAVGSPLPAPLAGNTQPLSLSTPINIAGLQINPLVLLGGAALGVFLITRMASKR